MSRDVAAASAEPVGDPAAAVVHWLAEAPRRALFVTELGARWGRAGFAAARLDPTLEALQASGSVAVVDHPSPDPHLDAIDRRTVGLAPAAGAAAQARGAAEDVWNEWLRGFLASHRCCS